jgi:predicted aminopeptidase
METTCTGTWYQTWTRISDAAVEAGWTRFRCTGCTDAMFVYKGQRRTEAEYDAWLADHAEALRRYEEAYDADMAEAEAAWEAEIDVARMRYAEAESARWARAGYY